MGKKRELRGSELKLLRYLASRRWCSTTLTGDEAKIARFLKGRGIVSQDNERSPFQITVDGLVEIAKSGQVTIFDPAQLVERWSEVYKMASPVLKRISVRNVDIYGHIDPSRPWENITCNVELAESDNIWISEFGHTARWILYAINRWLDCELSGEGSYSYHHLTKRLEEWTFPDGAKLKELMGK